MQVTDVLGGRVSMHLTVIDPYDNDPFWGIQHNRTALSSSHQAPLSDPYSPPVLLCPTQFRIWYNLNAPNHVRPAQTTTRGQVVADTIVHIEFVVPLFQGPLGRGYLPRSPVHVLLHWFTAFWT